VLDNPQVTKGSEKRDVRFSMRLPTSLHIRLRKVSEADRRTMGDFAIIAIERAVEEFEATIAAKKSDKPTR